MPATLVARYKPVDVMRGSLRHRTKQVYSKVLIVIQNAITVAMLATSLTVYAQTRHLIDAPLGYDTKDILMLRHDIFDGYDQMRRLRDELRSEPSVEAVAFSTATPLTKGSNWTMQYDDGRMISFEYFVADSVFFRILASNCCATTIPKDGGSTNTHSNRWISPRIRPASAWRT